MTVEEFWNAFQKDEKLDADTEYLESFYFDMTEKWANELLRMVQIHQKRAASSSLLTYQKAGLRMPQVGDYSIVTDWEGNPGCVIKTTAVTIVPFRDITYDLCCLEGEDENLESWRNSHIQFFTEEGQDVGYSFSEDMPVVFEHFEAVYQCVSVQGTDFCFRETDGEDDDFAGLCGKLDQYLDEIVGGNRQREQYEKYNTREDIHDVILVYDHGTPVACGSFREYDEDNAELKRIFVEPEYRRRGIGKILVWMLEARAASRNYECCILETGRILQEAYQMYQKLGYQKVPNYGPYADMTGSVCMRKRI